MVFVCKQTVGVVAHRHPMNVNVIVQSGSIDRVLCRKKHGRELARCINRDVFGNVFRNFHILRENQLIVSLFMLSFPFLQEWRLWVGSVECLVGACIILLRRLSHTQIVLLSAICLVCAYNCTIIYLILQDRAMFFMNQIIMISIFQATFFALKTAMFDFYSVVGSIGLI